MNPDEYIREQIELGLFSVKVLNAREVNSRMCQKHRIQFEGNMTPQEELFSKFFSSGKIAVKDMSNLDMRAYREEISQVALEARAILSAIDWEERDRDSKGKSKTGGFSRNVNIDDVSSDAIHAIERRQDRLSKKEKVRKSLLDMGVDAADVEKIMSARNIRDTVNRPISNPGKVAKVADPFANIKLDFPEPKSIVNPFLKKTQSTESTNESNKE